MSFQAFANEQYFFQVGSNDNNSAGCDLCLGIELTICAGDTTGPDAELTLPAPFDCGCNPVAIIGTANDPDGGFGSYVLEYRPASGGAWTLINSSTTAVVNGVLANWDTTGLLEDWYLLRLTAKNACGLENTAVNILRLSKEFDTLEVRSPTNTGGVTLILGGTVCMDGTVSDNGCFDSYFVEYQTGGVGPFNPVDPNNTEYFIPITNDPFAFWKTLDPVFPIADGNYNIRVRATDRCTNLKEELVGVIIDNTAPEAVITQPINCDYVDGVVEVRGTADDANLANWVLQYTGGNVNNWVTIASGTTPVINNGVLGNWNTTGLPACAYTIRLVVWDKAIID